MLFGAAMIDTPTLAVIGLVASALFYLPPAVLTLRGEATFIGGRAWRS
jgi:hypothetical protein